MYQAYFRPRLRHPLVRLLGGILGLLVVLALLALGVFAIAALVLGGIVLMIVNALRGARKVRMNSAHTDPPRTGIIDGEFTVVRHDTPRTPR